MGLSHRLPGFDSNSVVPPHPTDRVADYGKQLGTRARTVAFKIYNAAHQMAGPKCNYVATQDCYF